ncbi:MAG: hypothetical protein ABI353_21200 [Isosphaeraceae bacterium]
MAVYDELLALDWPGEFVVEYGNGTSERLMRGEGVEFLLPADDPDECGGLFASLPKMRPRNQKQGGRFIRFTELRAVCSTDGRRLWPDA